MLASIVRRLTSLVVALLVVLGGVLASFAFFCVAVFDGFSDLLSPPLAALATAAAVLVGALLIAGICVLIGRTKRKGPTGDDTIAAGEALGAIFARQLQNFAGRKPATTLVVSLVAGFVIGATSLLRRRRK